jgi:hypothetical protein
LERREIAVHAVDRFHRDQHAPGAGFARAPERLFERTGSLCRAACRAAPEA